MSILDDLKNFIGGIEGKSAYQSMVYPNQPNGLPAGSSTQPIIMNNPIKDAGGSKTVQANQFLAAENQAINKAGGTNYASAPPTGMMELAQNMPQGLHGLSYATGLMHGHQLALQQQLPEPLVNHNY